ncbi:sigma-54-dependent Fis family transcriptional regulator [Fusibacter sp. 3D3]|uniref:sigma-54 interaction domain-containing protein n=1 Tax=Fusibacter sp. 3D3 TaxID=1048380 RepID=UPI000853DBC2|nr:sigma 54-interacting transcriptional regulator [Fusibacter sp. 3D3]GAU79523.1 response regulator of zinc sigma-54-dependent two-component system [Fusibacter sp. 3D3]
MHLNIDKALFFERGGLLDKILDSSFDRALIVDKNLKIIFFSDSSKRMSGKTDEDVIGVPVNEIIKSSGFEKVLRTGKSDKGVLTNLDGNLGLASHIPVFDGKALLGAIGIVYFNRISAINKILAETPKTENNEYANLYHSLSRNASSYTFSDYIGESKIVKDLIDKTKRAACSNFPILFIGETGTGKEILANAVHNHNNLTLSNPFVKINCSAIPSELLESELFGYEKGAFTGASASKKGKFEVANDGSILLDEIGDMSFPMQTKLLRVLEEKEFERVGGNRLIPTNARVIAATNRNLLTLSHEKKFREDLYYRLNTLEIRVPSLREHISDLPMLIQYFIQKNHLELTFSEASLDLMLRYSWPGNVRQLRNLINRFSVLNKGESIAANEVESLLYTENKSEGLEFLDREKHLIVGDDSIEERALKTLDQIENEAIRIALRAYKGNKSLAAASLAISRSTMMRKIKQYQIEE